MIFTTTSPTGVGVAADVGTVIYYVSGGAATQYFKYGTANTSWCTIPPYGTAEPVTTDPAIGGLARAVGTRVLYVTGNVGTLKWKYGTGNTDWATWAISAVGAHTHPESDITNLVSDLAGKQPLDADLTALAASAATAGLVERTGAATYTTRLIGVTNSTDVLTRADGDTRYGLGTGIYGSGYDGDVTISVSASLSRESAYNNLTIDAGVVLTVARFPITVLGTLTNNGTIRSNGADSTGTSGGAGGGAGAAGFLGVGSTGGAGGVGAGGSNGAASSNQPSLTGATCVGGVGGAGSAGAGGNGGTITANTAAGHPFTASPSLGAFPYPSAASVNGGTGGGGGGGNGAQGGGGGGGGGGVIVIKAKTIVNNGAIEANGGNGYVGGGSNCGGGGGGGGGKVLIMTRSFSGTTPTVTKGLKGLSGGGTGVDGVDGTDGIVVTLAM